MCKRDWSHLGIRENKMRPTLEVQDWKTFWEESRAIYYNSRHAKTIAEKKRKVQLGVAWFQPYCSQVSKEYTCRADFQKCEHATCVSLRGKRNRPVRRKLPSPQRWSRCCCCSFRRPSPGFQASLERRGNRTTEDDRTDSPHEDTSKSLF